MKYCYINTVIYIILLFILLTNDFFYENMKANFCCKIIKSAIVKAILDWRWYEENLEA